MKNFFTNRIIPCLCVCVMASISVQEASAFFTPPLLAARATTAYQQLSFRTLRTYLPGKKPPQEIMELNGKSVEIMGFMAALTQLEEIDEFVLSSSPPMNCFCHPPLRVNEVIFVQMKKGKKTDYKGGVVRIRGKLVVNTSVTDEFADIMYTVECDEVL
ncbi:MAG: DUF3299 domain-containing protein [Candidatus Kapaibacterium sp.]|nr:MAG: DUF3299 domain-containing protein [Candidatus Kapabacteria bacterium]